MSVPMYIVTIIIAAVAFIIGLISGMAISDSWWRKYTNKKGAK